jgi:hypothetical protein
VLSVAQPADQDGIGLPRLWSGVDPAGFAERFAAASAGTDAVPLPPRVGKDSGEKGATSV